MENFDVERLLLLANQHPQQFEQIISLLKEQEKTKQIQIQEQEKTKQIQEQEKTKQEQERTKQLQLKLQRSDSTSYSTASQFYNNLSIRKESPDWEKNSNTIITISKNDKIHNEDTLQDALMPIFAEVCKGTTLSAYDIRNTITLPDLKPDVVLIPSVFTLQPPLNPKMQTNWGELCQEGGLVHLIQSVIEIKGIAVNINTSEPKGKILAYLRSILDNQPLKNEAIGALTNGKSIIFFRVKRCEPSGLDYFESDLFPFIDFRLGVALEGLQYLIGMINRICIEIPLPSSTLVLTKYLGKGATSFVYKHSCDEAVKLCSSHNLIYSFIVEGDVLAALNKELPQDLKKHIPNILEHGNCYLKFPLYKPQSTTTSLEKFLPIVDLLEKVHKIGYCHRDIRPENILISTDNNLVLIDWGYSGKKSNEPAFFGTATFCAQEYANKQLGNIDSPYRPEYDFESLFKTIMYLQNESVRTKFAKIRKKGLLFKERLKMALDIWTDTNIPDNITAEIIRDYILNNKFSNDMNLNADY